MSDFDASGLQEYVIPILLESSEGFKPMLAKKKFEQVAALLAKQAYWLAWFEWMEKMGGKVESIRFSTAREKSSFEQARKRANSKLYSKLAPDEADLLAQTFQCARSAVDEVVRPGDKDKVLGAVLGPQLGALRMSKAVKGALEELLWESAAPASGPSAAGGFGRPRI